jgi:1-phosphofructokinase family hexose kinase
VILSAGLTPAWQQVLVFDAFTPGAVNRARRAHGCASGKVLNAARALHHLGAPVRALTVVGGPAGTLIREDFARLGIAARWVESVTPTRVCTTILDAATHTATELVPNAAGLGPGDLDAFAAGYALEAAAAEVVVLIGSLPAGTPPGYYRDLLARTPGTVILDARGPELLEALAGRPFLVKPNRDELGQTLGRRLADDENLFAALRELNDRGAAWVVVTDGGHPAHAASAGRLYRLRPPPREAVNPIGCGDCMAAAVAASVAAGADPLDAIVTGLAAAASKLGRELPGVLDKGEAKALVRQVEVTRL